MKKTIYLLIILLSLFNSLSAEDAALVQINLSVKNGVSEWKPQHAFLRDNINPKGKLTSIEMTELDNYRKNNISLVVNIPKKTGNYVIGQEAGQVTYINYTTNENIIFGNGRISVEELDNQSYKITIDIKQDKYTISGAAIVNMSKIKSIK